MRVILEFGDCVRIIDRHRFALAERQTKKANRLRPISVRVSDEFEFHWKKRAGAETPAPLDRVRDNQLDRAGGCARSRGSLDKNVHCVFVCVGVAQPADGEA